LHNPVHLTTSPTVFESARAKIARAREHLDFLKADFARFVGGDPYSIRKEPDPDSDITLVVYYPEPIPACWSIILGEFLYDLRSALDHLVYDLSGAMPHTEFPIYAEIQRFFETRRKHKRHGFTDRSGVYKLRGISNDPAWFVIEKMQPYNAENPKGTALWGLHELNNIDKHRTLHLCRRRPLYATLETDRPFTFSESEVRIPESLEHRAVVGRLRGVDSEVNVKYHFASYITFDEGEVPAIVGARVDVVCELFISQVNLVVDKIESLVV
jgi:hypothetical protein